MEKEKIALVWPEWEIEKRLGKGSYGVVYQAIRRDHNITSRAAIKVISIPSDPSEVDSLRSEGMSDGSVKNYFHEIVEDFITEIQLMEEMKGIQNIVSVEDYKVVERENEIGWDIFIRMELLIPFNTYLGNNPMNESDVIRMGVELCTALELCSKKKIIHRDIKPENIFINEFGYFKLGDFGIARKMESASKSLSQKGTYNYMAPEVFFGQKYDERVDIYSLGIVLYRLLNQNHLPFLENEQQLSNPNERKNALDKRLAGEKLPPPCEASEPTAAVILMACDHRPEKRFASASAMKTALLQAQEEIQNPIPPKKTEIPSETKDDDVTRRVKRSEKGKDEIVPDFRKDEPLPPKPAQSARNLNLLCLVALISCGLPVVFWILALNKEVEGKLWIPIMILSLIPVLLANLGRRTVGRTGTMGRTAALISLMTGLFFFALTGRNLFEDLNRLGEISYKTCTLFSYILPGIVSVPAIGLYVLSVFKDKKK